MYKCNVEEIDWKYVAEGNANIILFNEQTHTVLRVKKSLKSGANVKTPPTPVTCKMENMFLLQDEMKFLDSILKPLFKNTSYLPHLSTTIVSSAFLENLAKEIENDRPIKRVYKGIDIKTIEIVTMAHMGFLQRKFETSSRSSIKKDSSVFIEIKPKCGFLPQRSCNSNPIKTKVCRFCMHQVTKLKMGKINTASSYCPLNLFSNHVCCVRYALSSLFKTPQNNLNVYVDGRKVHECYFDAGNQSSDIQSTEHLVDILVKILFDDSKKIYGGMLHLENPLASSGRKFCKFDIANCRAHTNSCSKNCPYSSEGLMGGGGILALLKYLQMLDEQNIEQILPLYEKLMEENKNLIHDISNFDSQVWKDTVKYLCTKGFLQNQHSLIVNSNVIEICKYLISSTFKDCSLAVTLQHSSDKNDTLQCTGKSECRIFDEQSQSLYDYQIKVLDVDPRYVSNIPYYHHIDQEIITNYVAIDKSV